MSIQTAVEFLEKANQDVALQKELSAMVEGKLESACGPFVELASTHGFEFTIEEFHEILDTLRREDLEGELTDDDLQNVAGGRPDFRLDFNPRVSWMSKPVYNMVYGTPERGARFR